MPGPLSKLIPGLGGPGAKLVYGHGERVCGRTLAEWAAEWWRWVSETPYDRGAYFDETGELCRSRQNEDVFFLSTFAGPRALRTLCSAPMSRPILVPVFTTYGARELGRANGRVLSVETTVGIIKRAMARTSEMYLSVDGVDVPKLGGFSVVSRPFGTTFASGSTLEATLSSDATFDEVAREFEVGRRYEDIVVGGTFVMLRPLEPGRRRIRFGYRSVHGEWEAHVGYDLAIR